MSSSPIYENAQDFDYWIRKQADLAVDKATKLASKGRVNIRELAVHAITDTAEYYETVSDTLLPVMLDKDPKHVRHIAINKAQQFLRLAAAAHRLEIEGVGGSVLKRKKRRWLK